MWTALALGALWAVSSFTSRNSYLSNGSRPNRMPIMPFIQGTCFEPQHELTSLGGPSSDGLVDLSVGPAAFEVAHLASTGNTDLQRTSQNMISLIPIMENATSQDTMSLSPACQPQPMLVTYKRRIREAPQRNINAFPSPPLPTRLWRSGRRCTLDAYKDEDSLSKAMNRKALLNGDYSRIRDYVDGNNVPATPIEIEGLRSVTMLNNLSQLNMKERLSTLGFDCNDGNWSRVEAAIADLSAPIDGGRLHSFKGQFIIAATLRHLRSGIIYTIASVYGPPHHASRASFFAELSSFVGNCNNHLILGGDFNVTLRSHERWNCVGNPNDAAHFSRVIAGTNLIDLPISGIRYTWSNGQSVPKMAKLDRIFLSLSTTQIIPLATVQGGDKKLSDHHHLLLCSKQSFTNLNRPFRMESNWFRLNSFKEMIVACWAENWNYLSATERWTKRWRVLRKLIRQWNSIHSKEVRKTRLLLEGKVAVLDKKADLGTLTDREADELRGSKKQLDSLYSDEDTFWRQRAKQRWILLGDRNTRYFHLCASLSKKKNWIHYLNGPSGPLTISKRKRKMVSPSMASKLCSTKPSPGLIPHLHGHSKPGHLSPTLQEQPIGRRKATTAALASILLAKESVSSSNAASAFEFRFTAPEQTPEEADAVVKLHARDLVKIKAFMDSKSWREVQTALRESSALLKQDLYTIIQAKPGSQRPQLRKLYSDLFNNVSSLDYAARDQDANRVQECFDNIVATLNEIFVLI
ncbi:psbQ-like protein 3, chloroplastic [Canna indica]|uniref:PsbQ-like protein 3, chloroplastic n=1 Tax=Canna indica TaxID=4628 RepID=A0AAQ3KBS0_9LILI|nr:psbQ-like protein 3, chloroplastic [Canna indica]